MSRNTPDNHGGQQFNKTGVASEQTMSSSTTSSSAQIENKTASASQTSPGATAVKPPANELNATIERNLPEVGNRASEVIEQTKQVASDAYDRTISYGKQNPGTLTLIAFGAGVGLGLLLAGGFSSRSRTGNLIDPAAGLLTTLAKEFFR